MKWHGDELAKLVRRATERNLERAAITLKNAVKEVISEPSNKGTTPSAPGEPPHKDTGRLRASISHEVDKDAMAARVGTNVVYGKFLEIGTRKMAARPYLRPTYERLKPELAKILTRKVDGKAGQKD